MKIQYRLITFSLILLISACSGVNPSIRSNSNPTVEFNQYKTFGFFEKLDTDQRYESLVSQYLKTATTKEMTQRGFILSNDKPDLLINFHSNVESKQYIEQYPVSVTGDYYNYRRGLYYDEWVGYRTFVNNYKEGTLNIDIVDRQQNKMVWEGIAIGQLTEENQKNLQSTLQKTVSDIFAQFPAQK